MASEEAGKDERQRLELAMRRISELEAENAQLKRDAVQLRQDVAELKQDVAKLRGIVRMRIQEAKPTKLKDALRE